MKDRILVGGCILLGIFGVLMFLVGIPMLQNMDKPLNVPHDIFLHEASAEVPVSDECREKQSMAAQLVQPLRMAQNAVNDEQNAIGSRGAALIPEGNHTVPSNQYILPSERDRYEELSEQYFTLGQQIDAVELKYACM